MAPPSIALTIGSRMVIVFWARSPISFRMYVFSVDVLGVTPNHIPLEHRCSIKRRNLTKHVYRRTLHLGFAIVPISNSQVQLLLIIVMTSSIINCFIDMENTFGNSHVLFYPRGEHCIHNLWFMVTSILVMHQKTAWVGGYLIAYHNSL